MSDKPPPPPPPPPPPGSRGRLWRDIACVALQELRDAMRSRRALIIILLFLLGSTAGTLISIRTIHFFEESLGNALGLDAGTGTGSTTAALWRNEGFRHAVIGMVGDKALAESLLDAPPLSLFFCFITFLFTPLLVTLTSAPRLAEEIWSGSARFVLFRTSRLAWCLGKFGGQALLLLAALMISVPAAWLCGLLRMNDYPALATAWAMFLFAGKAWIYGVAYLGLASGISLLFRSPGLATACGIMALMGVSILYHVAGYFAGPGLARSWDALQCIAPRNYYLEILKPDLLHGGTAALTLLLLGLGYLLLGYLRLARRDL